MDGLSKLIGALAALVGSVAWPAVVVFIFWRLGPAPGIFLGNLREGSLKLFGIEASAKTKDAVSALVTAQIAKTEPEGTDFKEPSALVRIGSFVANATSFVTSTILRKLDNKRVLWVDDNPDNNLWERNALEALGVKVNPVISTEKAIEALSAPGEEYNIIISDMTRGANKMAGYELLSQVQNSGRKTPFIIYAGSSTPEQERVAIERGAVGRASDPENLIRIVAKALT